MCYLYLNDYLLAEDAIQDTYIKAIVDTMMYQSESKQLER